jgi:hypothetical protein
MKAYQCKICYTSTGTSTTHICIFNKVDHLEAQNNKLKAALQLWKKSFYCDGETQEKADLKELSFNEFVPAVEELDLD